MTNQLFETLLALPLEQQIGQLLYVGLPGTELDAETADLLRDVMPGGVILFGRNVASPQQVREMLDGVRELIAVPPLLGIDQEGGLVDRLRRICTPMPPPRVIRQHGDLAAARALGRLTGEILLTLGFNMNFAPVLSIMTEDRDLLSNGLYSRSFGRSPGEVLGYAMVYIRGLLGTGCLGCAKHFPGIGAGEIDSHEEMPIIKLTHDDLLALDLAPYIELFQRADNMVKAVMVSHGGFPNINVHSGLAGGRLEPASLNHNIVTDLLREELEYEGLVVTDDLEMGAIGKHCSIEEAVLRAVLAGEDMVLICAKPELARRGFDSLLGAVEEGQISQERLHASLRRIAHYKELTLAAPPFDLSRFESLSGEVAALNRKLNYTYGGKF